MGHGGRVPRGSARRGAAGGHGAPLVSRRSTNILRALCACLYLCVPRACPPAQNVVGARAYKQAYVAIAAMQILQRLLAHRPLARSRGLTDARRARRRMR